MVHGWQSATELYKRFRAADSKAAADVFECLYKFIYGKFQNSLNEQDCEDIAQNTLLDALDQAEQLLDPENFVAWIKRIAFHKACTLCKQRRTDGSLREIPLTTEIDDIDESIEQATWRISLNQELQSLSDNEFEAFILTKYEKYSYAEAAKMTGRSVHSIAQAASGACKKLRKALGDYSAEKQ